MLDPRVTRLAELLVGHATALTPDDRVLIHAFDVPDAAVAEVVRVALATGSKVSVKLESTVVQRALLMGVDDANVELIAGVDLYEMRQMTAYLALRGAQNSLETADVPSAQKARWQRLHGEPVHLKQRVPHTKWVALRWPTPGMAQQASMSTAGFEDYYFRVCCADYERMARAVQPLKDLMDRTDRVHLKGPGTDLTFSIKDIGAVPCVGHRNIPDGECFSCPVKDSVNGTIQFNTVSLYQGQEFANIHYRLRDGKIIEAEAGAMTDRLNEILDTDDGARYIGEWSLGFNPHVLHPMKDTLFDEKIAGSFHFTPGNAYPPPGGNGNVSAIHWDTVCIQRPEYGGGEVWFDDVLIRKDGLFTLPELQDLNPDRLGA